MEVGRPRCAYVVVVVVGDDACRVRATPGDAKAAPSNVEALGCVVRIVYADPVPSCGC